jgi:beta-glucanase (GH16 family)
VRGRTAFATDEGPPRYRLDWDEGGVTWEVDGKPFASLDDFAATMEGFAVVDRATWEAWLPGPLADALRQHPDETVQWSEQRGVKAEPPYAGNAGVSSIPAPTR